MSKRFFGWGEQKIDGRSPPLRDGKHLAPPKQKVEMGNMAAETSNVGDDELIVSVGHSEVEPSSLVSADSASLQASKEDLKAELRRRSESSVAEEEYGGGWLGRVKHKLDGIIHNPFMETLIIFLILTEVVCVSIEIVLGDVFKLGHFPETYKELKMSWTSEHPNDCAVQTQIDAHRRVLMMMEAGMPVGLDAVNAALRALSGGGGSGPVEAGCYPLIAYSWHHTAELISITCLSIMLFEVFTEVFVDGPNEFFFAPHGCDWKHMLHIFDFFVVTVSWVADVIFKDEIHGAGPSLLVVLRLWRVIRVIVGFASFVKRDQEKEEEKQALLAKLRHATKYLKKMGQLEDFKAVDKAMDHADMLKLVAEAERLKDTDPGKAAEIEQRIADWKDHQGEILAMVGVGKKEKSGFGGILEAREAKKAADKKS